MKSFIIPAALLVISLGSLAACVTSTDRPTASTNLAEEQGDTSSTSTTEVETKSLQTIENDNTTVQFLPGSSDLTAIEKDKLRDLVDSTKLEAPIETFIVAAWADKEYPEVGAELSKADRDLAEKRASAVKDALKDLNGGSVDTYSMATHPGWVARVFHTETSDIKTGSGKATDKNQLATQIGQKLRKMGGPGSAVVVVKFKGQVSSY